VFRAKSMTRAGRVLPRLALILAAASCGGLPASSAWAASASAAPAPPSAPTSPLERLEQLDQLHADLELARLRAAIRKANAEGLEPAGGPAVGVAGGPPLPQLGSGNPLLNLSPISAPNQAAEKRKATRRANQAKAKANAKEEKAAKEDTRSKQNNNRAIRAQRRENKIFGSDAK